MAPVNDARVSRSEPKDHRLCALIQALLPSAAALLDTLSKETKVDIVVSAPLRSPEVIRQVLERVEVEIVKAVPMQTQRVASIRHAMTGGDPHATLAVPEPGGQPWVLWLCADSMLNAGDLFRLEHQAMLSTVSRPSGVRPGEAVVALLLQRVGPEGEGDSSSGWWLDRTIEREHAPRSAKRRRNQSPPLQDLLAERWPVATGDAVEEPSRIVVDALGLSGRPAEVAEALNGCWPSLELIGDGISVDTWCGWPGEALTALQIVLAIAPLEADESALVLNVVDDQRSRCLVLQGCAASGENVNIAT